MERTKDMLAYLEPTINQLLEHKENDMKNPYLLKGQDFSNVFSAIKEHISNPEEEIIVISYLRSSYVTKSHKFRFAVYQKDEAFIEEYPKYYMHDLEFLFGRMDEIEYLIKILHQKFIRIMDGEKEEIRRFFMAQVYSRGSIFFREILKDKRLSDGEKSVDVYYGAEMGEITCIGTV